MPRLQALFLLKRLTPLSMSPIDYSKIILENEIKELSKRHACYFQTGGLAFGILCAMYYMHLNLVKKRTKVLWAARGLLTSRGRKYRKRGVKEQVEMLQKEKKRSYNNLNSVPLLLIIIAG